MYGFQGIYAFLFVLVMTCPAESQDAGIAGGPAFDSPGGFGEPGRHTLDRLNNNGFPLPDGASILTNDLDRSILPSLEANRPSPLEVFQAPDFRESLWHYVQTPARRRAVEILAADTPYDLSDTPNYKQYLPQNLGVRTPLDIILDGANEGPPVRAAGMADPGYCPACQPSDPEIGLTTLSGLPDIVLSDRLQGAMRDDNPSSNLVKLEIEQCGGAVQLLRAPISEEFGNMVDDFNSGCLKRPTYQLFSDLGGRAKTEMSRCLAAHVLYEENCLQQLGEVADKRVVGRIGLLFNVVAKGGEEPACTATLISETLIVTARHCYLLSALALPDGIELENGNGALVFAPNPFLFTENGADTSPRFITIAGEVTASGDRPIELVPSFPPPSEDVIALRLKEPVQLESPRLSITWGEAALGDELTIIGFQELSFRRTLLEQRIKDLGLTTGKELLDQAAFSAFVRVDHGPMCVVGDVTSGQFGHYCQSFNGTSGAPIFAGNLATLDPEKPIRLVGFQSRGNASDVPDKEVAGPPNTAAQITGEMAALLGLN